MNIINVLCATDNNYVPYCGVMLTSLFENNGSEKIRVFVMTDGLSQKNAGDFQKLAKQYGQTIEIVTVDKESFSHCPFNPDTDHVSLATYYRLGVAELLPADIDRVLYLDCDMIVNGSLRGLYDTEIADVACAVVTDEASMLPDHYERLGLPRDPAFPYFNAGMLLINLDYWRAHDIGERCMQFIATNTSRLAFHDQDTLNCILRAHVRYLPLRYNLQRELLLKETYDLLDSENRAGLHEAIKRPIIIHFTGVGKPWIKDCRNPFTKVWLEVNEKTIWKNLPLVSPKRKIKDQLLWIRNEIIWKFGLKPRPCDYII